MNKPQQTTVVLLAHAAHSLHKQFSQDWATHLNLAFDVYCEDNSFYSLMYAIAELSSDKLKQLAEHLEEIVILEYQAETVLDDINN